MCFSSFDPILPSQTETTVNDKSGDLLIKAGEETEISIVNEEKGTSLHWKITPNDEVCLFGWSKKKTFFET